ncbi:unnamed protein product (macronuclear) [Paramecium tetraurelia]|uniref:Aminotransferase class V domain-containing protein n=1 Tax=Paramecium tetraurelia TaxID=5888 RepID=A0EC08_PARTE|nr:uncharacterized protein GSPATT00025561001 [Paramecium tetraurelia]CAK92825.1 unnamed protein product [Paramecium tetraurelia]|eukprot:XP_001460222.1 hypothetical protein (macronuclear) [Paramecium tetraurelia strain d4-2]
MSQGFGNQLKEDFVIEPGYICVNHSSFGYIPKTVLKKRIENQKRFLENPDSFVRFLVPKESPIARRTAADFLNANFNQCYFTSNSAESMNSIIKSLKLSDKDTVLYLNIAYPMVQNVIKYINTHEKVNTCRVELKVEDLDKEIILSLIEENMKTKKITVAILDYISSLPSIKLPTKEFVELCKKYDVISIIDGAHGAGISEIDLKDLDPDFFFTNLNKWAFCPCSVNLLYMKEKYLNQIHNNTISVFYGAGIEKEFEYYGTRDSSVILSVVDGINYINQFGLKNIIQYCENLAWEGSELVAKIWETELMVKEKRMHSAMVNVLVPHKDHSYVLECQKTCFEKHNVLVIVFEFDGRSWARFSASIYNCLEDYEYAAQQFLNVLKKER